MTVNNVVKNAHVASISGTDGTQSDRLVKKGSFSPQTSSKRETCFIPSEACSQPQKQMNIKMVDYNCHEDVFRR